MTSDAKPPGDAGDGPVDEPPGERSGERYRATRCRRFRVTGLVQGVFFRDSTRELAEKLDLTGYANNKADGSVEVVVCGRPDALERMGAWLKSGPPMASVATLEILEAEIVAYRKFTIG